MVCEDCQLFELSTAAKKCGTKVKISPFQSNDDYEWQCKVSTLYCTASALMK